MMPGFMPVPTVPVTPVILKPLGVTSVPLEELALTIEVECNVDVPLSCLGTPINAGPSTETSKNANAVYSVFIGAEMEAHYHFTSP